MVKTEILKEYPNVNHNLRNICIFPQYIDDKWLYVKRYKKHLRVKILSSFIHDSFQSDKWTTCGSRTDIWEPLLKGFFINAGFGTVLTLHCPPSERCPLGPFLNVGAMFFCASASRDFAQFSWGIKPAHTKNLSKNPWKGPVMCLWDVLLLCWAGRF